MKTFIIDGTASSSPNICAALEKILGDWDIEKLIVRNASVFPCLVCNGCSERTIGECVVKDDGALIAKHAAQCNLFVVISDVVFGGLSSLAKRALERTLPNILPYFTIYKKELHHKLRYSRRPNMLFIGYLPEADEKQEELFYRFARRSARNFMVSHDVHVVRGESENFQEILKKKVLQLQGGNT